MNSVYLTGRIDTGRHGRIAAFRPVDDGIGRVGFLCHGDIVGGKRRQRLVEEGPITARAATCAHCR